MTILPHLFSEEDNILSKKIVNLILVPCKENTNKIKIIDQTIFYLWSIILILFMFCPKIYPIYKGLSRIIGSQSKHLKGRSRPPVGNGFGPNVGDGFG